MRTYIYSNIVNGIVKVYINAECEAQAKSILNYTVIQPENFQFEMEIK